MAIEDLSRGIRKCADACIKALDKYSGGAWIPNEPNGRTSMHFDKAYRFAFQGPFCQATCQFRKKVTESLTAAS